MPTAIARIGREKRLRTLAQNLFVIEGPNRAAELRRVEQALLRQNPQLADPAAYRPGAVVLVPSGLGLATKPRVEQPSADLDGLLQETLQRLQTTQTVVSDAFARSSEGAKEALERLEDQDFRRTLQKESSEAGKLVPTAKSLRERLEANKKREVELSEVIEQAISEIDRLRRLTRQEG